MPVPHDEGSDMNAQDSETDQPRLSGLYTRSGVVVSSIDDVTSLGTHTGPVRDARDSDVSSRRVDPERRLGRSQMHNKMDAELLSASTPPSSASGQEDRRALWQSDAQLASDSALERTAGEAASLGRTESSLPQVAATHSTWLEQTTSPATSYHEDATFCRVMTERRRLSFAAHLAEGTSQPPPERPPTEDSDSHTPQKHSQGGDAPWRSEVNCGHCCPWFFSRGAVAPDSSDGSTASRTSAASQVHNSAVPAHLTPAVFKALHRPRRRRGYAALKKLRSWRWWSSVTDEYTGKKVQFRMGQALHPLCPLSLAWNTYLNLLIGILVIVLPLLAGFVIDNDFLDFFHRFSAASFLLDVIFTFARGYRIGTTSDHIELRPAMVASHYARTWLVYDVLVSLPWRAILPTMLGSHWVVSTPELKHALPLIELGRVLTLHSRTSFLNLELLQIKHATRSIVKFASFVAISSHLMACAWMLMALVHISWFGKPEHTWLETAGIDLDRDSMGSQYMQCLYYSVTIMATIGFGDIVPNNGYERALSIVAMIVGSWTYAYCITQAAEQIANLNLADSRFRKHQDMLLEYMAARNLPRELRSRLLAYYKFQRRHAAVFHRETDILQDLPPRLHAEVKAFSNADTCKAIKGMQLFRGFADTILTKLIVSLRSQFLPPDEIVCMEGERGRHTYLIRKGYLDVTVKGVRLAQLADGECFGERALISDQAKRRATVTTRTYCQLFLLSRSSVQAAFAAHPRAWNVLQKRAETQWHTFSVNQLPRAQARGYPEEPGMDETNAPFSFERSLPKSQNGSLISVKSEGLERLVQNLCSEVAELKRLMKDRGPDTDDDNDGMVSARGA